MTLTGLIEALGFGSARDARLLVERLPPGTGLTVATADERIARALDKAQHCRAALAPGALADAALALGVPEGDAGLATLEQLVGATRDGGQVIIASIPELGRTVDRARVSGLFLRMGLVGLMQDVQGGVVYTMGRVKHLG